jgi:hypothetical protein
MPGVTNVRNPLRKSIQRAGAWLSTSEAAAILKVTIQTIGRLCQNELLTSHLIPNGREENDVSPPGVSRC